MPRGTGRSSGRPWRCPDPSAPIVHPLAADDQIASEISSRRRSSAAWWTCQPEGPTRTMNSLSAISQVEVVNRSHLVVIDLLHILQDTVAMFRAVGQCLRKYPLARRGVTLRTLRQVSTLPHRRPGGRSSFLTAPPPYAKWSRVEGLDFGARLYKRRQSGGNSYRAFRTARQPGAWAASQDRWKKAACICGQDSGRRPPPQHTHQGKA